MEQTSEMLKKKKNDPKIKIYNRFYSEVKKIDFCDYDDFVKELDKVIGSNPNEYTLENIKPRNFHKTFDEMIKDIIKLNLLPETKDIVYRCIYINTFYDNAIIKDMNDKDGSLAKMKSIVNKMYDLVINEMNKDRSKFKEIYDNQDNYK